MKITDKNGVVYQLVPVEPTQEQKAEGQAVIDYLANDGIERYWHDIYGEGYKAMLSAAPDPELPEWLEPVAFVETDEDGYFYFSDKTNGLPLASLPAAAAALANKAAEIAALKLSASTDTETILQSFEKIERQAALIEKCRQKLFSASICHPNGVLNLVEEAIAAIEEFKNE